MLFAKLFQNLIFNYTILVFLLLLNDISITNGQRRQQRRRYQQQQKSLPLLSRSADGCVTSLRKPGTCRQLSTCQEALYYLKYYRLQPQICSAQSRFNPIVCCGQTGQAKPKVQSRIEQPNSQQPSSGQRLSDKKCFEQYLASYGRTSTPTIVGGTKTQTGEFPYMAAIGWAKAYGDGYDFKCGGVLIAKRFVLTAAHCCNLGGSAPSVVQTGGFSLNSGRGNILKVSEVFVHPQYVNRYHYNDIGLLKLYDFVPQTPACLGQNLNTVSPGNAIAIGYGTTAFAGRFSDDLLKIVVRTFTSQDCKAYFPPSELIPQGISNGHLCAGSPGNGRDTCQGDSGGPLILSGNVQNTQIPFVIGVTSFGKSCGGDVPGVYTKVSNYLSWIESIVWECKVLRGNEEIPCKNEV